MKKLLLTLFSIGMLGVAQAQSVVGDSMFTDRTFVYGSVLWPSTQIYETVNWDNPTELEEGTIVIVSGVDIQRRSYLEDVHFFEILYKNKTYYIQTDDLKFPKDIDYFSEISKLSEEQKTTFRLLAKATEEYRHLETLNKVNTFLKSCKVKGLAVLRWGIYDESEYTNGTSFEIEFYNPTNKTVKYITTTVVGYNSVGDKVYNAVRKSYNCQVKSIGPIKPGESGSYSFDYVWFTDLVETMKVVSIVVQYMDGTIKTITNPESIKLKRSLYDYIQE